MIFNWRFHTSHNMYRSEHKRVWNEDINLDVVIYSHYVDLWARIRLLKKNVWNEIKWGLEIEL